MLLFNLLGNETVTETGKKLEEQIKMILCIKFNKNLVENKNETDLRLKTK